MFPIIFGMSAYTVINTLGNAAAALCAAVILFLEWRRRKRQGLIEQTRNVRRRFSPVVFMAYLVFSYMVMSPSLRLMSFLLNITKVAGRVMVFNSGIAFASGVLVFIPLFLLLAKIFPGNGKPTEQLELIFPALALNHVFSRLACFMSGCCFGIPSSFGIAFPAYAQASYAYGAGTRVFPTQLTESGMMLLCFILILVLRARGKRTLPIFPLVFGATGFLLGFVMDHSHERLQPLFGFTYPTPFSHLLVFFVGVGFLLLVAREKKKATIGAWTANDASL